MTDVKHKIKTKTVAYTHEDGTPLSDSDRHWYISLSYAVGVSVVVTVAMLFLLIALGGWPIVLLGVGMVMFGAGLILAFDREEQWEIDKRRDAERKRRRSRDKTDPVVR